MSIRKFGLGFAAAASLAFLLGAAPDDVPATQSQRLQEERPAAEFAWGGYYGYHESPELYHPFLSFDSQGRVVVRAHPGLLAKGNEERASSLMQFSPTGDLRWSRRLYGHVLLGPDDSVYVLGSNATRISPDGEIIYSLDGYYADWRELTRGNMAPVVNSTGDMFAVCMTMSGSFPQPKDFVGKKNARPDYYVARVTGSGELAWALPLGKMGGSSLSPVRLAADDAANAFVAFTVGKGEVPVPNGFDPQGDGHGVYVAKVAPSGKVEWGAYLGDAGAHRLTEIYADGAGGVIVLGWGSSRDFPVENALLPQTGGGRDVFVARIDASGRLAWSGLLGGAEEDYIYLSAQDSGGNVIVCGVTESADFPVTVGPNAVGREGYFYGIFVSKVTADGGLCWSRLFSRRENEPVIIPRQLGVSPAGPSQLCADQAGNVYVAIETGIPGLQTYNGFARNDPANDPWDVYLAKITPSGQLAWGTYLGGNNDPYDDGETCGALLVAPNGDVTSVCKTSAEDFPTAKAFQKTMRGGADCAVTRFKSDGSLAWSSYLGGSLGDTPLKASLDNQGNVALFCRSASVDLPLPANEKAPGKPHWRGAFTYLAVIKEQ